MVKTKHDKLLCDNILRFSKISQDILSMLKLTVVRVCNDFLYSDRDSISFSRYSFCAK